MCHRSVCHALQPVASLLTTASLLPLPQALDIPDDLKALYKTVWEIKQRVLVDMAAGAAYVEGPAGPDFQGDFWPSLRHS